MLNMESRSLQVFFGVMLVVFMSSTSLQSGAAPIASVPGETSCNHSIVDNMATVHEHFSNSVDQFHDYHDSHPGLEQFNVYKRRADEIVRKTCDELKLPSFHQDQPEPTPTASSLVCPYELQCTQTTDTYPRFFYETKCSSTLDRRGAFSCKEVTYPLKVLRRYPCGDGQFRWGWDTLRIKTACVAYGAEKGYKTIADTDVELNNLPE